ncbi:MAG: hypothetical protein Tsb0021_15650 [Chlamydiales bacterium]
MSIQFQNHFSINDVVKQQNVLKTIIPEAISEIEDIFQMAQDQYSKNLTPTHTVLKAQRFTQLMRRFKSVSQNIKDKEVLEKLQSCTSALEGIPKKKAFDEVTFDLGALKLIILELHSIKTGSSFPTESFSKEEEQEFSRIAHCLFHHCKKNVSKIVKMMYQPSDFYTSLFIEKTLSIIYANQNDPDFLLPPNASSENINSLLQEGIDLISKSLKQPSKFPEVDEIYNELVSLYNQNIEAADIVIDHKQLDKLKEKIEKAENAFSKKKKIGGGLITTKFKQIEALRSAVKIIEKANQFNIIDHAKPKDLVNVYEKALSTLISYDQQAKIQEQTEEVANAFENQPLLLIKAAQEEREIDKVFIYEKALELIHQKIVKKSTQEKIKATQRQLQKVREEMIIQREKWIKEGSNLIITSRQENSEEIHTKIIRKAEQVAKTYKGELTSLIERKHAEKDQNTAEFLSLIIHVACENIKNRDDAEGFIYQIKNKKNGVISHLIGTFHKSNKHTIENKGYRNIIQQSSVLYTEVGDDPVLEFQQKMEAFYKKFNDSDDPLSYSMDEHFPKIAKEFNVPTKSLELASVVSKKNEEKSEKREKNPHYVISDEQMQWLKVHQNHIMFELFEAWQNGDEKAVEFLSSFDHPIEKQYCDERTLTWVLEGLISRVEDSNEPVCIAVGALHLFGTQGLIKYFRENEFEVTKINVKQAIEETPLKGLFEIDYQNVKGASRSSQTVRGDLFLCDIQYRDETTTKRMLTLSEFFKLLDMTHPLNQFNHDLKTGKFGSFTTHT